MLEGLLSPGMVLGGDFRVVEPLKSGGMGAVYVAEQVSTGQRRALKIMHPTLLSNPRLRERFEQEARIGSRIASDHVVAVIAAGIDAQQGIPWLAMELLHGQNLADAIDARGRFDFDQVLRVFRPLCHALSAAHAVGIVHRDIKPENVFLATAHSADRDLAVKVLDFGIAKLLAEAQDSGTANVGTPLWMAPEQTDHRAAIGPAADIWPLGLMAYRMLTGQYYWRSANDPGGSVQSLLREGLIEPIAPPSARAAEQGVHGVLPAGFDDWFARTVNRDPGARFASAAEALAALERLATGTAVATSITPPTAVSRPTQPSPPSARPRTGWLAAGAFGLFAIGAVAALGLAATVFFFRTEIGHALAGTSPAPTPPAVASSPLPAASIAPTPAAAAGSATPAEPATARKPSAATTPPPASSTAASAAPTAAKPSGLAPFDSAAATAKVNAAVAQASSSCKGQKGDAAVESYKGSIGFNPDGSRSMGFQGMGGSRQCVRDIMAGVRIPKYAPDPKDPWRVDVVQYSVTIQ